MKKKIILVIGILVITVLVLGSKDSFANPEVIENETINLTLMNNSDEEKLKNDIFNFIDLIDNNLMTNSSFNMSSSLNENYDFLTKFAISFILDNEEDYEIIDGEEYKYVDEYGEVFVTNKYINEEIIYEITNQVFGIDYYYILNDYLEVDNHLVPLLELVSYNFSMELDEVVRIDKNDDYYDVFVRYQGIDLEYVYRFGLVDDRLVIENLSVME